jgi:hypothetical protein
MDKETIRKNEMVDKWTEAWKNHNLGNDYSYARKFREYWISECPGLGIEKAWNKYRVLYD